MKKVLIGDIVEIIISIISLIFLALLAILVITPLKYVFLIGSIFASLNVAYLWESISSSFKNVRNN